MAYTTNLKGSSGTFGAMMAGGFGIVTVMNAYVCDALHVDTLKALDPYTIANAEYVVGENVPNGDSTKDKDAKVLCRLDTLKVANVTMEGPTKTVTGGQFSNALIKFGKSARLEMQDALGNAAAIQALCGGVAEYNGQETPSVVGLHFGEDFSGPKMIIGDSFFIDKKTGQQVPVKIVFYQFLPDSLFNLTQDAEGDATVFDMNGDLLTTVVTIGDEKGNEIEHGLFYSIVDVSAEDPAYNTPSQD